MSQRNQPEETFPRPRDVNDSQWKAVTDPASKLLIVAGPGTGKTHTILYRMARSYHFLQGQEKILAVTFTNKAADQMKTRLEKKFRCDPEKFFVGTFHQFCLSLLRMYPDAAGLREGFSVADPQEIEEAFASGRPGLKRKEVRKKLNGIWEVKSSAFDPDDEAVKEYNDFLRKRNLLDFDDLMIGAIRLLGQDENRRERIQKRFPYIFVDEYQDINRLQHELLRRLVSPKTALTAIGDPNQAIYGFRGSRVSFFQSFDGDFEGARRIYLDENFRSTFNLLEASSQVIASSGFDIPPLTANIMEKGRLTISSAVSDRAEAEYVVHNIEKMVGGTSMFSQDSGRVGYDAFGERSFGDIAVCYRLNAQRRVLEEAFKRSGIPFQVSGDKSYVSTDQRSYESEAVQLMTLHAAKGLEFPVVFIVGCEEGLIPLRLNGMESEPEEERRLFYVGMTRAKEELFLVHSERRFLYGQELKLKPTPFLSDIAETLKTYQKSGTKDKKKKKNETKQFELFKL